MIDTSLGSSPTFSQVLPDDTVRPETAAHLHAADLAHMVMLTESDLVDPATGAAILAMLLDTEIEGVFAARDAIGGGNLAGVRLAEARLGVPIGGQLALGRSAGEIAATGFRLFARERLCELMEGLYLLREALVRFAAAHDTDIVPAQVQGGPARTTTFGHWALMIDSALTRDSERLVSLYVRINRSTAGVGGLEGASVPVNRLRVAELLGFDGLVENTYDAVAGQDLMVEFATNIAILTQTAARLAEDLLLWAGPAYGLITLPETAFATRLSQDAGPDVLRDIRVLAARAQGAAVSALSGGNGPSATANFGRATVESPIAGVTAAALVALPQLAQLLDDLTIETGRAARAAARQWTLASDLALALERHCGLSQHRAEALTEAVIRDGLSRGTGPETLSAEAFDRVAAEAGFTGVRLTQDQIDAALDPRSYVDRRAGTGGPGREGFTRGLMSAKARIRLGRSRLADRRARLDRADADLHAAADALLLSPRKAARG